jgi:hypothetical protein
MQHQTGTADQRLARIAAKQWGNVAHRQARAAGVTPEQIRTRLKRGSLLPVFRGVYRVGHAAPSTEAHYMAAVLACGDGAKLTGRAAGHLLALIKGAPPQPEVTTRNERRIKGVRTRRARDVEAMRWRGIPVTTFARTLVDLAAVLSAKELARAAHEATIRRRTTPAEVEAVLCRHPNSPGAAKLRRILHGDGELTLSVLEDGFLAFCRKHGLPLPLTNRPAGGRFVDCRWPGHKLTVELDSYRFHNSRHAWEQDRRREREAYARGDQFRRYTWGDVFEDQRAMLRELCGLFSPAALRGPS